VTVTSTFAYSPLGSSVPLVAISTVGCVEGVGGVGVGVAVGVGFGVGLGGRLAATDAELPMMSATARSTAA
jgi:hypothetical protein